MTAGASLRHRVRRLELAERPRLLWAPTGAQPRDGLAAHEHVIAVLARNGDVGLRIVSEFPPEGPAEVTAP